MKLKKAIGPLLVCVFLSLLYWHTGVWLVHSWLSNPYYEHGFLILLISGFIIWRNRAELRGAGHSNTGIIVFGLGLLVYILGFIWNMRFLLAFSFLIVLGGLILYFYGTKTLRTMIFPLCFLIFMIPLPFVDKLAYHLQAFSAHNSASLCQAIGLPIITTGAEIRLKGSTFVVGLPCSGMNTLIALLALVVIFIYLLRGAFYKKALLFTLAIPVAIFANVFRITSLLLVANHFGDEAAIGFFHPLSSLIFFLLAFLILAILAKLFKCRLTLPFAAKG